MQEDNVDAANGDRSPNGYERIRANENVSIYRDTKKSPNWVLDFWIKGRQIRQSTKTSNKRMAMDVARQKNKEIILGVAAATPRKRMKAADGVEEMLKHRQQRRNLVRNTIKTYRANLNDFVSFLNDRGITFLDQILGEHVDGFERYLRQKAEAVPPLDSKNQPRRVRNKTGTLHNKLQNALQLIKFALKKGWIEQDPSRQFEMPKRVHVQAYCWTTSELAAIAAQIKPSRRQEFDFLRYTGLRGGEFRWLGKDDIDLEKKLLHVREKRSPDGKLIWRPKTGNGRIVPLCPEALEIAKKRLTTDQTPWLFTRANNQGELKQVTLEQLRYQIKHAAKKAGVPHGTTHTLRHAFCSYLANSGVIPFATMKIMGHRSLDIVLVYYHIDQQQLTQAMASVDFGKMLTSTPAKELGAVNTI